jgi:O-antigen/teichoic acid export membrane protein
VKEKVIAFLTNKQSSNLVIYGMGQGFNLITPLLVIPYIISICGVENYGKASIGMAISFFIMVFIDYGSDIIGVKEAAVNRENHAILEQTFLTTFTAKLVLLTAVLITISLVFYFAPFFNTEKELFFLGLPILIGQFLNPTWFLQGVENFKWITILTIFSKLIYLFGIFTCIHDKGDYIFINLWWGIGTIIANGIAFYYLLRSYSFSFGNTQKTAVIAMLKGNFPMFFSQIFVSLQMYAPIMLIGFFGNNLMAGQYKIVEQIIVIFKTYILLFFNFVYPRVCFLLGKNFREALRFWKIYNGINLLFILLSMGIIYLFSTNAVAYFSTTDIEEISNLLRLAVLIPIALGFSIPLKQLLLGLNKQRVYIRITMFMVVLSLLLMIVLLPLYGIYGVLLILLFAELATVLIYYYHLRKETNPALL